MLTSDLTKPYKFLFMLEYGCDCLWAADDKTKNKFGYQIKNLSEVGLTNSTQGLSEFVSELYELRLNPIYQMLPSFWSGKMHKHFQDKVTKLYNQVVIEISDKFDIVVSKSAEQEMKEHLDIDMLNQNLKKFVDNPVDHFFVNKIHFNDKETLINEVKFEFEKWKIQELKIFT